MPLLALPPLSSPCPASLVLVHPPGALGWVRSTKVEVPPFFAVCVSLSKLLPLFLVEEDGTSFLSTVTDLVVHGPHLKFLPIVVSGCAVTSLPTLFPSHCPMGDTNDVVITTAVALFVAPPLKEGPLLSLLFLLSSFVAEL